ncbi:MAG: AI-2E family transporter [Candidatus Nanopelagicales bacterium]
MTGPDMTRADLIPAPLRYGGSMGWAVIGVAGGLAAAYIAFRLLSGLIIPVAVALVLAVLLLPLTEWLARRMPRGVAVGIVLLFAAGVGFLFGWIFIKGVANETPAISASIQAGVARLQAELGVTSGSVSGSVSNSTQSATQVVTGAKGLAGLVVGGLNSAVSLFFGVFIATMVFFLVLLNPKESQGWVARVLPWPRAQADRLFTTFGQVIRDYYKGSTILAAVNAFPIWVVALMLDIPAAGSVFVVLFVTSYIPYIGAWLGGAFAVLLALGSGGTTDGWLMLAAVLVVNLGLQSAVQPFAYSSTMKVSALGVFLITLLGGLVAGVFGAMMAAPIMALSNRFDRDVRLPAESDEVIGSGSPVDPAIDPA